MEMRTIKFGGGEGNLWPWDTAEEVYPDVFMAKNDIITIESEEPPQFKEHGWLTHKAWFIRVENLMIKEYVSIYRNVLNAMRLMAEILILRDYRNKKQCKWTMMDLLAQRDKFYKTETYMDIPIIDVKDWVPNKRYNAYANRPD